MTLHAMMAAAVAAFLLVAADDRATIQMRRVKEGDGERTSIKESLDRLEKARAKRTQTEIPFDLVLGQSLPFLRLKEKPFSIQVLNRQIVEFIRVDPNDLVLSPKGIGRTRMNLTFGEQADRFIATLVINVRPYEAGRGGERRISTKDSLDRLKKALAKRDDAEVPLNLGLGQPLVIPVEELPTLLLVNDPKVLEFTVQSEKSVLLQPKGVGRTPMAMRFRVGRDQFEWFVITLQVKVHEAGSR
jgi:Pilus formation protein N terminal region